MYSIKNHTKKIPLVFRQSLVTIKMDTEQMGKASVSLLRCCCDRNALTREAAEEVRNTKRHERAKRERTATESAFWGTCSCF